MTRGMRRGRWIFAAFGSMTGACGSDRGSETDHPAAIAEVTEPSPAEYESPIPVAQSIEPSMSESEQVLELVGAPTKRTRTIAAMMFNISGTAPDPARIGDLLTGPGNSLRHMYNEISFGLQDIQVDLKGPFTLPIANCLTIACCGPSSDRTGNGATVQGFIDTFPVIYDHYFWVYGTIPPGANCGTWGDEGTANTPAVYSSYSFQSIVGLSQELGHNFGMTHEPTLTCAGGATFLDDSTQCTHKEYGSSLSFMGSGAHHPSAYHKLQEGWIGKCNVVRAGGSGTYTLVPQELPCDGVQLLQVRAPRARPAPAAGDRQGQGPTLGFYYLELRAPYGFDSNLRPMVVVSIGADLPTSTQRGSPYLYVLDQAPATTTLNDAGLMTAGQTYQDPGGGLTITLNAIDARSASITITTTATATGDVCADQTAFTAPGLDATSCGPLVGAGDAGAPPVILDAGVPPARDAAPGRDAARDGATAVPGQTDASRDANRMPDSAGGSGGAAGAGGIVMSDASGASGGSAPTGAGGGAAGAGATTPGGAAGAQPGPGVEGGCSCSTVGGASGKRGVFVNWAAVCALGLTRLRRNRKAKKKALFV